MPSNRAAPRNARTVIILGSAPRATQAAGWKIPGDTILVAINNAWQLRNDWDYLIHPDDFDEQRRPKTIAPGQQIITSKTYVPAQNRYGGFVYAGGTMAFTAGYWALDALKPATIAWFGCDMVYEGGQTHFYGQGEADPLREDVTLRSLEAKSTRLMALAARRGCSCVNLSEAPKSRLVFPRAKLGVNPAPMQFDEQTVHTALQAENELGYLVENGEYWHHMDEFDADKLAEIDAIWEQYSR